MLRLRTFTIDMARMPLHFWRRRQISKLIWVRDTDHQHATLASNDLRMVHQIQSRLSRILRKVISYGTIQNSKQTHHPSDGMHMASQSKDHIHHQPLFFGRDRLKWVKAIRHSHHSGVTLASQYQMVLINSLLVIAGS